MADTTTSTTTAAAAEVPTTTTTTTTTEAPTTEAPTIPKKAKSKSKRLPPAGPEVGITMIANTSQTSFDTYFRMTETSRRVVMSDSLNRSKKFFQLINELYGIEKGAIQAYYLYSPIKYSILLNAYMRFQPKLLARLLRDIGVIRFIYLISWDKEDGVDLKHTRWDIVISDKEIVGRDEFVDGP